MVKSTKRQTKRKQKQTRRKQRQTQRQRGGGIPGISPYAVIANPMNWDAKN